MSEAAEVVVVLSTVPPDRAEDLAEALVRSGLAACVNQIGPVRSRYVWQGAVESAEETLLLIKTTAARAPDLRARLVELHPYEVPEVIQLAVAGGLPAYLQWVVDSVRPAPGREPRR